MARRYLSRSVMHCRLHGLNQRSCHPARYVIARNKKLITAPLSRQTNLELAMWMSKRPREASGDRWLSAPAARMHFTRQ